MIVQIYEIQTPYEAEACIEAGVDHIGSVILSETGWKNPELKETIGISNGSHAKNTIIPLFEDIDAISRAIDYYRPDFIHFCESLTDEMGGEVDFDRYVIIQKNIKKRFPEVKIIRSIPVPEMDMVKADFPTLTIASVFEPFSDLFLTDTWIGKDPVRGYIGITGRRCNPETVRKLVNQSSVPVILAGGLSPENVFEAVMDIRPEGADSCTLTNKLDTRRKPIRFQKDFEKVKGFVSEIRRSEMALSEEKELLKAEIKELKEQLKDREDALPAHSVRPNQLQAIEELEEKIAEKEDSLAKLG